MRERLLTAVLDELARCYRAWLDQPQPGDADGCGLRGEYLRRSGTVGTAVTVMLPGGQNLTGMAAGIDAAGRLEIRTARRPGPGQRGGRCPSARRGAADSRMSWA